ncbi:efflux pump antibiotic resistance protein [Aspergillus niger CBS 101883]|uniref:efflux pump antibiotic resistance protein n=1 Tax=Aspergillus lacticoffeatus (strain CBS 101883) TaxID=1450533 RepID=UPI000D7EE8AF|nr:efflux pump antibiotic resistance protein [Aspergillus niger CBS 101883]PYH55116.1 efflux pump antibiotic resistance protein [Aspergillus niger CBS 101883]
MTLDAEVQIDRKVKKYGGHVSKGDVESTETTGPDNLESDWKPTKEVFLILLCLSIIAIMASLDMTIFLSILPSIAKDLNGDATSTFWVGSAYLVPSAGFQPIMASFSDVYGRRRVLAMALALFVIGSIVGCLAHNMATLLAGRVIQGIGGGGLIPLATIIITDVVPLRPRPKYAALVQASMALGTILGPLIGGAFLEHTSSSTGWRWVFYINFPLSTAAGILLFFSVRFKRGGAQLRAVDWFGQALFLASISIFLIGLSWGGVQYTWESYHTLVPLCLGVGGIVATVCWEILGTEHPFVRISVLQDRSALAVYAGSIVQGILMYGELYYISVYLQAVKSMSAVMTGVGLLPVSVALMPTSIVVAIFISKTGRYRWALWFGWAATIAATGVTIILDSDTNTASWIFIFAFVGFGHGVLFNALLISAQASCAAADAAYAASMYTFFRTLGFAIGVIIGSTVLQNFMSMKLHELDLPTAIAQNAEGFIETLKTLASGSALREGIGVLGLLATAFVAAKTMNKPIESDHVLHDTCDSAKN